MDVTKDPQYQEINKQILTLEGELLRSASEPVKKLYMEIDSLVCKQHEREKELLTIY